jgi:pyruvate/2-oxoglutarate dehydrogenase complex dihydrolipoamide acyltransferase (E2) component
MNTTGPTGIKSNLSRTGTDLREFVKSLEGKSPKEAMGVVAQSKLARSLVLSFVIQAVALLLLSLPAILAPEKPAQATAAAPGAAPQAPAAPQPQQPATPEPTPATAAATPDAAPAEDRPATRENVDAAPVRNPTEDTDIRLDDMLE